MSTLAERRGELKATPRSVRRDRNSATEVPAIPYVSYAGKFVRTLVSASDLPMLEVCCQCGFYYNRTVGESPEEGLCCWCWAMKQRLEGVKVLVFQWYRLPIEDACFEDNTRGA